MGLIKKYETGELIGTGSMGSVYRARDIVLERDVALKILHSRGDLDPELKERFYREARTGAQLRHPNVVVVYELDELDGVPFMAMELLSGADVRRYIKERKPVSLAQKVELFAQICDGLGEAHRRGIVHRDVKPSNIFIHEEQTAKILDFGIARISSSKLTISGKVLGTPNYMAPEQINRRQCDSRSDLFSAAIVFFEFLVYSHPFQSSFIPRRIVEEDPDSLFKRDPLIPKSLADLLYRALQKRPEHRIQTAEDFAAGLRAVLQELRTGMAAEPVIQRLSSEPLPDPTPVTEGSPDSPDGRLARFVQVNSDFEAAVQESDAVSARARFADMVRLEAVDERFTEALRESRAKLEWIQGEAQPAALAAAAGAAYSAPAGQWPPPGAAPSGFPSGSREGQPWDNSQSIFDDRTIERESPAASEELTRVCGSCGAMNREMGSFCNECGKPLSTSGDGERQGQPASRVSVLPSVAFRDRVLEFQTALARKTRALFAQAFAAGKRVRGQVSALPRRTQYAIWGGLGVCVTAIAILFTYQIFKPIPVERPMGSATVQAAQTALMESEIPSSKRLMVLSRGTTLNILGRITDPGQRLVRVQLVTPKPRRPGFVVLADLGQFSSNDPAVAWEYLGLSRSAAAVGGDAARGFSESLNSFLSRFPDTPQARLAALEQVQIHLNLADQAKAAGKERSQWQGDLEQAKRVMDAAGVSEVGPDQERQLLARFQELSKAVEPEASAEGTGGPKDMATAAEVAKLFRQAQTAWWNADWDQCDAAAKKIIEIAPQNKDAVEKANWWLYKSRTARERENQ